MSEKTADDICQRPGCGKRRAWHFGHGGLGVCNPGSDPDKAAQFAEVKDGGFIEQLRIYDPAEDSIPHLLENAQLKLDVMRYRTEAQRLSKMLEAVLRGPVAELATAADVLKKIQAAINSRAWVLQSRGAYEWDDDKYKEETFSAFQVVMDICNTALRGYNKQTELFATPAWELLERLEKELRLKEE